MRKNLALLSVTAESRGTNGIDVKYAKERKKERKKELQIYEQLIVKYHS